MGPVMTKTKFDWKYLKGDLDYVDMGSGWIMFKFTNEVDRYFVWRERPWFVQGLNLVLRPWEPLFDAYE